MGDELTTILGRAEARLEKGKPVKKGDMAILATAYGRALNKGKCPCNSGRQFEDCCKLRWNAVQRGDKKAREQREATTDPGFEQSRDGPPDDAVPVLQIHMSNTRGPLLSLSEQWKDRHPGDVARVLLTTYHSMMIQMMEQAVGMAHGAIDAVRNMRPLPQSPGAPTRFVRR